MIGFRMGTKVPSIKMATLLGRVSQTRKVRVRRSHAGGQIRPLAETGPPLAGSALVFEPRIVYND